MQRFVTFLSALLLAHMLSGALRAEESAAAASPERAVVTSPGAAVRSGPGDSFYLTDTLPEATTVEVYQRQADGWCAIRPPAESFSWVFSQNIVLVGDGLAEITQDDVAARVGSRLSAQRDVVQVRMKQGERVAILGRDEREGGLWYKVAPPAGEFRWIQAKDIGLGGKVAEAGPKLSQDSKVVTVSHDEPVAPPLADAARYGDAAPAKPATDNWTAAKSPPPVVDIRPIGGGGAAPVGGAASSGALADHLRALELQLSRMVAEPPTTWNIAPLEQAAEQLLARADTVEDRAAVKATLVKIDRFSSIQRRYAGGSAAVANAMPSGAPLGTAPIGAGGATTGQITGISVDPAGTADGQYDAVGTLRPVVSRRPGAPQFALVNAQGQVVTFVTPAPDVNLQPYIGQRIGVTGSRGYIPEFRRAHVTAGRVSPLNERIVR
jgi:hypothetical protein